MRPWQSPEQGDEHGLGFVHANTPAWNHLTRAPHTDRNWAALLEQTRYHHTWAGPVIAAQALSQCRDNRARPHPALGLLQEVRHIQFVVFFEDDTAAPRGSGVEHAGRRAVVGAGTGRNRGRGNRLGRVVP